MTVFRCCWSWVRWRKCDFKQPEKNYTKNTAWEINFRWYFAFLDWLNTTQFLLTHWQRATSIQAVQHCQSPDIDDYLTRCQIENQAEKIEY